MRPRGFETRSNRLKRALQIGSVAAATVTGGVVMPAVVMRGFPVVAGNPGLVALLVTVGFAGGFILRWQWPDYAPPTGDEGGEAGAGVVARLVPPVAPLQAEAAAKSGER